MPELPEVETLRRDLLSVVCGRRITAVTLVEPLVVKHPDPGDFVRGLTGQTIDDVERHAKYLQLHLRSGSSWVVHLMLEGQFFYQPSGTALASDIKLVVQLDDGHQLVLRDVVGLARTFLVTEEELDTVLKFDALGPEPLEPGFTYACFLSRLHRRTGMIKPLLLDQKVIAGIGNVYADEALFRARLHPKRKANTLTESELKRLYASIREVLQEGVQHRGTSATRGLYRDIWGQKGHYQDRLAVFRRQGKACTGCQGNVEQIQVGGRATFICPSCQVEAVPSAAGARGR
ncbi:MAG TPA: bifunctional DNA-formamidopyrimidine glycosylase/DNA-(apurinic or apyrimidinic site) lyase [Stenomitos sp.]